jgi:cytochrome c biogenesis protein CcmG, thiol:disulfide interchange protein DsbE
MTHDSGGSGPVTQAPAHEPGDTAGAAGPDAGTGAGRPRAARRHLRSIVIAVIALAGLAVVGIATVAVADNGASLSAPKRPVAARPFTLAALGAAGKQVSLARYAGRPVIVNFFASWCGPCQHETPLLASFYAAHHGQIPVIGIDSNDTTAAALKFVQAKHVGYPVAVDPFPAKTATSYGVIDLPQTFFLNARHQIVRHIIGQVTAGDLAAWAAQLR